MKILLVGAGGREHALAWKIKQSPLCDTLWCAPGNAGIANEAQCVDIAADDVEGLVSFAKENDVDFVVTGPEAPLVIGLADRLKEESIDVFGPSAAAAQLEGSKGFMKDLCRKYDIPTAAYERFTDLEKAKAYIEAQGAPIVIKADGLAAGKGVIVAETIEHALAAAEDMLSGNAFGESGASIVVEEFMDGEELSYFVLTDGKDICPLTTAQDHKRVFDGDKGPNTGGMGAYSPAHLTSPELEQTVIDTIIKPTVDAMNAEGCSFSGVLYAGLMIVNGVPKLVEYNIRFGDPECQPLMMRFDGDIVALLLACALGELGDLPPLEWKDETALCVVMAAKGYPGSYEKGSVIGGLDKANACADAFVFHAGTAVGSDGAVLAVGGRVLGVTALGSNVAEAQKKAYAAVDALEWAEGFCRRDIGWRAIAAQKKAA